MLITNHFERWVYVCVCVCGGGYEEKNLFGHLPLILIISMRHCTIRNFVTCGLKFLAFLILIVGSRHWQNFKEVYPIPAGPLKLQFRPRCANLFWLFWGYEPQKCFPTSFLAETYMTQPRTNLKITCNMPCTSGIISCKCFWAPVAPDRVPHYKLG